MEGGRPLGSDYSNHSDLLLFIYKITTIQENIIDGYFVIP